MLQSAQALQRPQLVSRRPAARRLVVRAYTGTNGVSSVQEMNRVIGKRISEAAANIGKARVARMNQAIGKFVKRAAEEATAVKASKPKASK